MKKIISLFFLFFPLFLFSQINQIDAKKIRVNWNKTTHLIFPSEISYFSSVEAFLVAEKHSKILSIKANQIGFKEKTNLTVATKDGKFYSYDVFYSDTIHNTAFDVQKEAYVQPYSVFVSSKNDAHLLFPDAIDYVDYGSADLLAEEVKEIQNLVKIKAVHKFGFESNVTVKTKNNAIYVFNVLFDDSKKDFVYSLGNVESVELNQEDLSDETREVLSKDVKNKGRDVFDLGVRKNKIDFTIHNIFVRKNKVLFNLDIVNDSFVDYDIDYLKFYIVDKKKNKKTASQDVEVFPLFVNEYLPFIKGKDNLKFIVCFEKFTIPDDKFFVIDITEKGGGRNIKYKVRNSSIINAKAL